MTDLTKIVRYPQKPVVELQNGCVATIGKFDALHLGHQVMLKQLLQVARSVQLPSVVIVFEPYPDEFFLGSKAPARLTELRDKYLFLSSWDIDYLIVLRFDRDMAALEPDQFVKHYLQYLLPVKYLLVGQDFRFGNRRAGDVYQLKQLLADWAQVAIVEDYQLGQFKVSSSLIRDLLKQGDVHKAQQYLGRRYTLTGRIVHGQKRGRSINFPTINIPLKRRLALRYGVYAVRVAGLSAGLGIDGVASVGVRPVVGGKQPLLEVYLFNFNDEVYGRLVTVSFYAFIREEWYFDDLQALQVQINKDVKQAKALLKGSS